ncbi:MAG: hypothetical protein ACRYF4_14785 [Janthinobacterium lividum]
MTAQPQDAFPHSWQARVLPGAPLIAPARQFVFPLAVPGEEDALARGALWLEVRPAVGGIFLAQCALGFAGGGVSTGVWPTPRPEDVLAIAGGYAYLIPTGEPERTELLPLRPVVSVHVADDPGALVLVGFHTVTVLTADAAWTSPRLSWEGVAVTGIREGVLHGTGWHMQSDRELPFALDLRTRELTGGGFLP